MDRYEEKIKIDENFQEAEEIKRKNEETIIVITKEKYLFVITENKVEYLGQQSEKTPPDLDRNNVDFIVLPEKEWTNTDVVVEIKPKIEGYIVEYSLDQQNWEIYQEAIIFKENGILYARLTNGLEQVGGFTQEEIKKIDKQLPTGSVKATEKTKDSITVEVTAKDTPKTNINGCSGIRGYYYSSDGGENYTDMKTQNTFTFENLNPGTSYDIYVKIEDKAGNSLPVNILVKTIAPKYLVRAGEMLVEPYAYSGNNMGSSTWQDSRICWLSFIWSC